MTAYGSEQTVSEALKKGAWCYTPKPFDVKRNQGTFNQVRK
jgi:DNA-binding NtrC family response regulator